MIRAGKSNGVWLDSGFPVVNVNIDIGHREWMISCVTNEDSLIDAIDDLKHMPYGFLIWESSIGLARHLAPGMVAGRSVLELGCGVGISGMVAQSLGGIVSQTDHQPGVLRLAEHNAAQNGIEGINRFIDDWSDWKHRERYDIILGADILYERAMHFHLKNIFRRNLAPGGAVLLSDPGRSQSMDLMLEMESNGWNIELTTIPVTLNPTAFDVRTVEVSILRCTPR